MGMTLREIVYDIGGGILDGRPFKAVQTGGPSGGCIPAEYLDMPVDYESLIERRLVHGLGRHDRHGRHVLHGGRGQVLHGLLPRRVVRQVRALPRRHHADVDAPRPDHAAARRRWTTWPSSSAWRAWSSAASLCGLGQGAPNPVFSTLRYFRDEYLAHIVDKVCPAGVCAIEQPAEVMA